MVIRIEPNNISEWYRLVSEASNKVGYVIDENIETYFVLTLDQYATDDDLPKHIIAIDFLEGLSATGQEGVEKLRSTGDRCLIISGFFPESAQRFNVDVNYFIDIGQQAYYVLSSKTHLKYDPDLFSKLGDEFVSLTHLMLAMRK